jgi:hypothetical protein
MHGLMAFDCLQASLSSSMISSCQQHTKEQTQHLNHEFNNTVLAHRSRTMKYLLMQNLINTPNALEPADCNDLSYSACADRPDRYADS